MDQVRGNCETMDQIKIFGNPQEPSNSLSVPCKSFHKIVIFILKARTKGGGCFAFYGSIIFTSLHKNVNMNFSCYDNDV